MTRLHHTSAKIVLIIGIGGMLVTQVVQAGIHYGVGGLVADPDTPAFLSIDGETGTVTVINPDIGFNISAIAQNPFTGILYAVGPRLQGETFYTMDPGTGALTQVNPDIGPPVRSMEFDPTTGTLYAAVGGTAERFGTIDPGTGAFTEINPDVGREMAGLGFDAAGNLYSSGSALADEPFYSINKADGVRTVINTDIGPPLQSLSFDSDLGALVGTFGGSSNQWRSLTTGGTLSGIISTLDYSVIALTAPLNSLPGDLNGDGFVGQDDLNIVLGDWGNMPPGDPRADPSGDGFVGQDDLNPVLADWGQGTPPVTLAGSSLSAAAVPEPASWVLAGLGALVVGLVRRRSFGSAPGR